MQYGVRSHMIELAPNHKIGLSLSGPVLIAAGCGGYGPAYQRLIDLTAFGALVTNPITLRPRRGAAQPRLVETAAGFILDTGLQNPGVRKVLRQYGPGWLRLGLPVIAHLPAAEPEDLRRTARVLAGHEAIAAIELGLPSGAAPNDVEPWLRAIRADCLLPVLIKLPLDRTLDLAEAAAKAAAEALVIGAPPPGTAFSPATGVMISGDLYGPALHNLALSAIEAVKSRVDLPLIAAGGIHTLAEAEACLKAGAMAVQLDSLLFIEPGLAYQLALALRLAQGDPPGG